MAILFTEVRKQPVVLTKFVHLIHQEIFYFLTHQQKQLVEIYTMMVLIGIIVLIHQEHLRLLNQLQETFL
jgi:hypothetical protein